MRELNNLEKDPAALIALSAEIVDFTEQTRYLLIPSEADLANAVILLRRLVLISHKILPAKSYFNLLRDLQRVVMTAEILASQRVEAMTSDESGQVKDKEAAYAEAVAHFKALLVAHPVGKIEGDKVAAKVRHQLCTEDVFCAACSFLELFLSKRGSIYYINGESPDFKETKKDRDPLSLENEVTLKTFASNLARPDSDRGDVERGQIDYGFNLLTKQYHLYSLMPKVVQWYEEGQTLMTPRRKIDVRKKFNLTLREYDTIMTMARQTGLVESIARRKGSQEKYTLNTKIEERVIEEAKRRGHTPNRALNAILKDFFMLIDNKRRKAQVREAHAAEATQK